MNKKGRYKNSDKELDRKEKILFNSNKNRLRSYALVTLSSTTLSLNYSYIIKIFEQYNRLYLSYISGKTVAIVGPASSIINTNNGKLIDSFDIVIRLNKALPLSKKIIKDTGIKTDIIYNSLNTESHPGQNNLDTRLYKKYGVKFVCCPYPFSGVFKQDILNYINMYKFDIPFRPVNKRKYSIFNNQLKTRPYTGTSAIMDILSYPIKLLYITGIDFYNTPYYSQYRRIRKSDLKHLKSNNIHNAYPQMEYLLFKSLNDNRIVLDNTLQNLLYKNYYNIHKHILKLNSGQIFSNINSDNNINFYDLIENSKKVLFINLTFDNDYIEDLNERYDLIFYLNGKYLIIYKDSILFNISLVRNINRNFKNSLKKYMKIFDIRSLNLDILTLFILISVFKKIDYKGYSIMKTRYKEDLIIKFFIKYNIINII